MNPIIALICAASTHATTVPKVQGMDGLPHLPIREGAGKPLAFIFVTHDCPVCNTYAPEIARIRHAYGSRVSLQLVYSEPQMSAKLARAHAKEYGLTGFTQWIDASRKFATYCGASVVPEVVIFDSQSQKVWTGRIDNLYLSLGVRQRSATIHDLRNALDAILTGKKPLSPKEQPVGCYILTPGAL